MSGGRAAGACSSTASSRASSSLPTRLRASRSRWRNRRSMSPNWDHEPFQLVPIETPMAWLERHAWPQLIWIAAMLLAAGMVSH